MLLLYVGAWAQQRTVKRKVFDYPVNEPVIGATVVAKGTQVGTTAKGRGTFSLTVPNKAETAPVSLTGATSACR